MEWREGSPTRLRIEDLARDLFEDGARHFDKVLARRAFQLAAFGFGRNVALDNDVAVVEE